MNFAKSIIHAINTSKVFVLIWSANTNTSEHILNEINQAFDQGITIIPFRIQDVQPTDEMRYYFGRTHWLDAIDPPLENHIATLRDNILKNLGREPLPAIEKVEEIEPQAIPITKKEPLRQVKKQEQAAAVQAEAGALKKGVNTLPIAAGAVAVLVLIVLSLSGVFKGSTPASNAQETQIQTTITSPPPTQKAATATPESPPWVNEFAEPILAAIKDREPDFQDDFSIDQPDWTFEVHNPGVDCTNTSAYNMNGRLHMKVDKGCNARADLQNLFLYNYVVQVDTYLQQLENTYYFNIHINGYNYTCEHQRFFLLYSNGEWGLYVCNLKRNGFVSFDPSDPVTITMISNGTKNAVYVKSVPVIFFTDNEKPLKDNYLSLILVGEGPSSPNTVEFDNLKVWDLDKIENVDW